MHQLILFYNFSTFQLHLPFVRWEIRKDAEKQIQKVDFDFKRTGRDVFAREQNWKSLENAFLRLLQCQWLLFFSRLSASFVVSLVLPVSDDPSYYTAQIM